MADQDSTHNKSEEAQERTPRQSGKERLHEQYVLSLLNFLQALDIPFYKREAPRYPAQPEHDRRKIGEYTMDERLKMVLDKVKILGQENLDLRSSLHATEGNYRKATEALAVNEQLAGDLALAIEVFADMLRAAQQRLIEEKISGAVSEAVAQLLSIISSVDKIDGRGVRTQTFDVRRQLLEMGLSNLRHDFAPDERLCGTCKGLSLVKFSSSYGLGEQQPGESPYPYVHEWVHACPNCYMGKVNFCKHCKKDIYRGHLLCNCPEVEKEQREKKAAQEAQRRTKLPRIKLSDYKEDLLWAEDADRYISVDEVGDVLEEHPDTDFFACYPIKDLVRPSAERVMEEMEEQAYDDAHPEDGDKVLEFSKDAEAKLQKLLDAWAKKNVHPRKMYMMDMDMMVEVDRAE